MPYKNREAFNEYNRRRQAANRAAVDALKDRPCLDCGGGFPPYVMQFDHVPERGKKHQNMSVLYGSRKVSAPGVQAELAKCDIVCANCHAARTYFRRVTNQTRGGVAR